jgi:16S rRNA (cytosine1402-N4)-methyltransferase
VGDTGYHDPVLVEEVLTYLEPGEQGLFFDGTLGGGGHARALLERCPGCRLLGSDRDPRALAEARERLAPFGERVRLHQGSYDQVIRARVGTGVLDGALLDLGVSSHQLDVDERGFGFRRGVSLDMRMDATAAGETAADLLNQADEARLVDVFRSYGDEPRARRLARAVIRRRPLASSDDLVGAMGAAFGRAPSQRDKARIFQAVRIALNDEIGSLERGLEGIREALRPGGTLVVLAYHSVEDRTVKLTFREWSTSCICPPELPVCVCRGAPLGRTLTSKPVRPTDEEVVRNPRARSARLRAWRKAA